MIFGVYPEFPRVQKCQVVACLSCRNFYVRSLFVLNFHGFVTTSDSCFLAGSTVIRQFGFSCFARASESVQHRFTFAGSTNVFCVQSVPVPSAAAVALQGSVSVRSPTAGRQLPFLRNVSSASPSADLVAA